MIGMPGFARADAESIADIEQFLCRATGEPVALGTVWIADGLLGRTVPTTRSPGRRPMLLIICWEMKASSSPAM